MSDTNSTDNRGLTAVVPEAEPIEVGRSLIVVIGINDYVHSNKLKNAVQDAIGLQQAMIDKLGFSAPIPALLDQAATKEAISSLVDDQLYEIVEENDNLIFFFAGHGTTRVRKVGDKEIETGYLVPVDAAKSWSEYVEIDPLLKSISALPARHILVILDSCESGLALGQSMNSFRSMQNPQNTNRYSKDLNGRISRKIITSAQRDQLAKDNGPIQGHSLFTGTLIDGFNWGKADLDGNGLISSSELGLFIQQQVAQASDSQQTPDFGSFHLDDRGEMVISLGNQSFDALKERAFSAIQKGEITIFKDLMNQIITLNPNDPKALYFAYRLHLFNGNIKDASISIQELIALNSPAGIIPLSTHDLETLRCYLNIPSWVHGFSLSESDFPFQIEIFSGIDDNSLNKIEEQEIGDLNGFRLEENHLFQFEFNNLSSSRCYIYLIDVDPVGRIESIPLWSWENEEIDWGGLQGREKSTVFRATKEELSGVNQLRFFSSPQRISQLFRPPAAAARSVGPQAFQDINLLDLMKIRTKSIFYTVV
jgi:Caspase domain